MERLTNAIALNAMVMSLTTMVVPVLAGNLIAAIGVESVYYVIAGMYILAVFFTTRLPKIEVPPRGRQTTVLGDIRDGFKYVFDNRVILVLLSPLLLYHNPRHADSVHHAHIRQGRVRGGPLTAWAC